MVLTLYEIALGCYFVVYEIHNEHNVGAISYIVSTIE